MELTKSVKALSAYGVQYNEIYDTSITCERNSLAACTEYSEAIAELSSPAILILLPSAPPRLIEAVASRDILYRSIDDALGHKRFTINVAVQHDQARKAVQDALLRAQVIGKDQALA